MDFYFNPQSANQDNKILWYIQDFSWESVTEK